MSGNMKKKQKRLAIDILKNKRREALKGLMQDPVKRQRLFVHSKSLTERKKNLQICFHLSGSLQKRPPACIVLEI